MNSFMLGIGTDVKQNNMDFSSVQVLVWSLFLGFYFTKGDNSCKDLEYLPCIDNKAMVGHVIDTFKFIIPGLTSCQNKCFHDDRCMSYNLGPVEGTITTCELNELDHLSHPDNVIRKQGYQYCPIKNPCLSNPCTGGKTCEHDVGTSSYRCVERRSCKDILEMGHTTSGVYDIVPNPGGKILKVYCDQETDGGGWTVIQRRKDGSVDFYRGWQDYKDGFGNLTGEFWLGLDNIHQLTNPTRNRLRVDLENDFAEFDYFAVDNEANKYKLTVGAYVKGTAGDSLTSWHNGQFFSTKDRDNDQFRSVNCAVTYKGAWWYRSCHQSNLNALYLNGAPAQFGAGINWFTWKGYYHSAKTSEMKLKPN